MSVVSSSRTVDDTSGNLQQRTSIVSSPHKSYQNNMENRKHSVERDTHSTNGTTDSDNATKTLTTKRTSTNSNPTISSVGTENTKDKNKSSKERAVGSSNYTQSTNSSETQIETTTLSRSISAHLKTFHKRFHLADSENLLGEFACALGKGVLMQGKLYLTNNYICFFSGLFGRPLRVVIHLKDVANIRKRNVAMIFPTAIQVELTNGKKYIFASFLARNAAFLRLGFLKHLHKQGKSSELKNNAQFEKLLETSDIMESDRDDVQTLDDSINSEPDDSNSPSVDEHELKQARKDKITETMKMFEKNNFTEVSMFDSSFADKDHLLVSSQLPMSVLQLGEMIALDQCYLEKIDSEIQTLDEDFNPSSTGEGKHRSPVISVVEEYHRRRGDTDLKVERWQRNASLGCVRKITYYSPVQNKALAVGISKTRNVENQRISLNPEKNFLLVEWTNELLDIPYGDTFIMQTRMEGREKVDKQSSPQCEIQIYLNIEWKKKVMWKRMIESNIYKETTESYKTLLEVLRKYWAGANHEEKPTHLKVKTDTAESSQKKKSPNSTTSEELFSNSARRDAFETRLKLVELQVYFLFILALLVAFMVLIGFFFSVRSQRTELQTVYNRIAELEEHSGNSKEMETHGETVEAFDKHEVDRLKDLVGELNSLMTSLTNTSVADTRENCSLQKNG